MITVSRNVERAMGPPGPPSGAAITTQPSRTATRFWTFVALFTSIYLLSWPTLFSFDLWVLKDRGSFLNLDHLLQQRLRLGVDAFYSYGLLPVLLQHWLFRLVGAGYWPLIGCSAVAMLLIAYFCARLLGYLPASTEWLVALLVMGRIINTVNPNLPYSFVQISILFALLFVLARRVEIGLAIASVGCWSVPSLPLVLSASLVVLIVLDWLIQPSRSFFQLVRRLLPGAVTYTTIGLILALQFGWKSVLATATPLAGMSYYHQAGYGSRQALMEFLHPSGFNASHYLVHAFLNPVVWWMFSTVLLLYLAARSIRRIFALGQFEPRASAIILCAIIQVTLATIAYGAPHQHYLYDPILIVGVLLGLADLQNRAAQRVLITAFLLLGVVGQASLLRATLHGWKQVKSLDTANLYADREWVSQWKPILELSQQHNVLMLSYSTGVHHYFPSIHSPEVWFVVHGQFFPEDVSRVSRQIDQAEVVVLDTTSPIDIDFLKPGSPLTSSFCLTRSTDDFLIWWRRTLVPAGTRCAVSNTASPPAAAGQM